ncbi:uncharacterized protein [Ptychodera flava]|uniref:uncharacterized protein isoform X2 n=1 Tax=Ptychodera flava TaxID=63121 RepID=UPI00396A888F
MSATYRFSSRSLDIYSIDYASPAPKPSKKRKIDEVVSETKEKKACACKNNCTTNRCSCNKNGDACDEQCKCSACSNPMNMLKIMAEYGVDVEKCKEDICLMQNMERMTEEKLRKRLETEMELFCCDTKAKLYKLIPEMLPLLLGSVPVSFITEDLSTNASIICCYCSPGLLSDVTWERKFILSIVSTLIFPYRTFVD